MSKLELLKDAPLHDGTLDGRFEFHKPKIPEQNEVIEFLYAIYRAKIHRLLTRYKGNYSAQKLLTSRTGLRIAL